MYTFNYCSENFEYLGEGSSRMVFAIDDEWVIKKAMTAGGYVQNSNEIKFYKKYKNTSLPLCPIDLSKCNEDVIFMKKAIPIIQLENELDCLYGEVDYFFNVYLNDCDTMYSSTKQKLDFIKYLHDKNYNKLTIELAQKLILIENSLFKYLCYDVCSFNCGLLDNEIVILDYGYPDCDDINLFASTETEEYLEFLNS